MWSLLCGADKDIALSLSDFMQIASTTSQNGYQLFIVKSSKIYYLSIELYTHFLLFELLNAMCDMQKNGMILFISLFID